MACIAVLFSRKHVFQTKCINKNQTNLLFWLNDVQSIPNIPNGQNIRYGISALQHALSQKKDTFEKLTECAKYHECVFNVN